MIGRWRNFLYETLLSSMLVVICLAAKCSFAQEAAPPIAPVDAMPIMRLEAGGPTSFVSAVALNPQGSTLYAGGWDKVVRAWNWDAESRQFILDAAGTYRVPIGPAMEGVINAVAVSPDGMWLATAGRGMVRGASDLRHPGWKVPAAGTMSAAMRQDQGTIYLFNTRTRDVRLLRGHTAPVVALAFAPALDGKPPILISAGQEWDDKARRFAGAVRAWDAPRGSYLGGVTLPNVTTRPSIAAWHAGAAPNQLRVVIAWGDASQSLRIWNVETNRTSTSADGQYNNTAAWWAEGKRIVTGSTGRLKLWNVAGAGDSATVERQLSLASREVPRAIALFASTEGGRVDRAAVLVKPGDTDSTVRMKIVDLANFRLLPGVDVALWDGAGVLPSLATAGGQLAVAGNHAHEIATFTAADLQGGQARASMLRGAGISAHAVSFAKKDGMLGVLVSQRPKPALGAALSEIAAGDLVLDAKRRGITDQTEGWQLSRAPLGTWRVELASAGTAGRTGGSVLTVKQGNRALRAIALPAGRELTAYALVPRAAPAGPILAVATHQLGQPLLELFDATTGAVVRELSGHVAAIEHLALSDDARLLASTAGDRTVCIWNLADLGSVVGARGALAGVVFQPQGQSLVVAEISADSTNHSGQLAVGDRLIGWVRAGRTEPIASLVDFYLQVSRRKPGESIALARQRGGQPAETIQLAVTQGADERKPLVTLFVTRGEPAGWIGWSPLGPYESSGGLVEQLLGWHFNAPLPSQPVRFATAGEYQHLRREGLVESLLSEGSLPDDKPKPLDRPATSIRLKQPGQDTVLVDEGAPLRISGLPAELELEIRGLPADQVGAVTYRIGDGQPTPLAPVSRQVWTTELADLPRERVPVQIQLAVKTAEAEPQTFREQFSLTYQPASPEIAELRPAAEHSIVKDPALKVAALVRSRESDSAGIVVRLTHTAGSREVTAKQFSGDGRVTVEQAIELQPGDNTITLSAANANAGADANDRERTVVVRRITFNPEATPPPDLKIDLITADGQVRRALGTDLGTPLIVDVPVVRLLGTISAEKPLIEAAWSLGEKQEPLPNFKKNSDVKIKIDQAVTLEPGVQHLRVLAQAERSVSTEAGLSVEYRPRLGELFLTAPRDDAELIEGRDARRVKITGRIGPVPEKRPFQAVILLNGQPLADAPTIDAAGETFSIEAELADGENRIEAQLSNAWGARARSEVVRVHYLRPPRIVEVSVPAVVDSPLVEVQFVLESPADLKPSALRINDWDLSPSSVHIERDAPAASRWKVVARDVPLREGMNEIRPLARNADGWSVLTKTAQVQVMLPPPPQAEIEFLSPALDRTVEAPEFDVRFTIRSLSRLKRVELRLGTETAATIDVEKQVVSAEPTTGQKPAGFRLDATARVELRPRDNVLRVVAINDGGESHAERIVTYVRKPVEVVVDRLQPTRDADEALVPELLEGGLLRFVNASPESSLWLHGRVRWPDAATQEQNRVSVVQVWVNGFLQQPVPLKVPRSPDLEWAWRAKIRLNRAGENEISVRLPGVARAADCRLDFKVDCTKPDERQRLHLLVVGVGEKDQRQLETLALRAVRGKRLAGDQISTPAFAKGWIYLVSGYVNRGRVTAQLERIHLRVGDPVDAGTDVVMVYYRGQESVDDRGQFYLLTSQSQFDPDTRSSAVSGRDLSERFTSVPGAQLFLLDVQRQMQAGANPAEGFPNAVAWPNEPQMAALRYAWLSNEAAPADARLLVAFDNALPRATRLGEIETEVSRDSERAREKYGANFEYVPQVPQSLRSLVLAKPAPVN
jgi:WD40 repeat protein